MLSTWGKCIFCNTKISTSMAVKHFSKCSKVNDVLKGEIDAYLIKIKDKYSAYYWLYVAVPLDYTLEDLDKFIRDIWVDCCGHASEFRINEITYPSDFVVDYDGKKSMKTKLSEILNKGLYFEYTYDYGNSTELKLEVISSVKIKDKYIYILGRNDNPLTRYSTSDKYIPNSPRVGICGYTGNKKLEESKIWPLKI
ncbi:IS1096 element passenger TnpR family protein [Acidianus brierleyi]|uniref:Plasmid pRiA4b Orf3-like domain-containing protein n=1 Tax=Acidianus brierleyi TaxID=41673 RepID=A0A2U9II16_9CREN|nr:hypothetical protein [Acidianus brierleyi]AWR95677.1 hypothetical protein DFR85_14855 [Acidianus brierleyi]